MAVNQATNLQPPEVTYPVNLIEQSLNYHCKQSIISLGVRALSQQAFHMAVSSPLISGLKGIEREVTLEMFLRLQSTSEKYLTFPHRLSKQSESYK